MGLLGAAYGLGAGVNDVADRRLKFIDENRMLQIKADVDTKREQRILEAKNLYSIQAEQRGLENDKIRAQNTIDINTNPDNVAKAANAEIAKLKTKDEYGDSRFDTELDQATRKARATDAATDHTDYLGRDLEHQLKLAQIDEYKSGKHIADSDKLALSDLKEQRRELSRQIDDATAYADRLETEGAGGVLILQARDRVQSLRDEMSDINSQSTAIWNKTGSNGGTSRPVKQDPVKELIDREMLKNEIKKFDPNAQDSGEAGGLDDLDSNQLGELLNKLKSEKTPAMNRLKSNGLLGGSKSKSPVAEPKPRGLLSSAHAASSESNSLRAMAESENDPDKLLDLIVPYLQPSDIDGLKSMPANQRGDRIRAIRDRLIRLGDI